MGLVLAGGKSSRMSVDKAMLKPFGAKTLLGISFALLGGLVSPCFVSCAPGRPYAGFPCIEDSINIEGPCRGALAGLEKARELGLDGVFILACDLPMMRADILRDLLKAHLDAGPEIWGSFYEKQSTGRVEMLAGVYSTRFLPALHEGISKGQRSLYWLLPVARKQIIPYGPEIEPFFLNCNTPADLRLASSLAI